ncbi:MAG TPA: HAMP domain-containing sensor histidine kinase [Candidatus Sulfotelmatobacter sp.]|nr:HAMP domain-containing sensor histidine kinase [Candidatus Sulfotelmatobacter sp.]
MLMLISLAILAGVLYFGTVGVMNRGIDGKLAALSSHLSARAGNDGTEALRQEIQRLLDDGIDSDTEVYDLVGPDGRTLAGNLMAKPEILDPDQLTDANVVRSGRPSYSRLLAHRLPDGGVLVVGRDLDDILRMESLVVRSLSVGAVVSTVIVLAGAALFRRMIDRRLSEIRRTTAKIGKGNMAWRVPMNKNEDEFSRLSRDINGMLDRIQTLMDGVRDVSNAIAHDLRTPLGRIRAKLDQALSNVNGADRLPLAVGEAIADIDDLVLLFQKLLEIAEMESGSRRYALGPIRLAEIVSGLTELYDAMAEESGTVLSSRIIGSPVAWGDRDLLALAASNLLDNAFKYAGNGATVVLAAEEMPDRVILSVADDGPGIAADQRQAVLKRFVRLETSRHMPGNGLGLSMVAAIADIHEGTLELQDVSPGLLARLILPKPMDNLSKR